MNKIAFSRSVASKYMELKKKFRLSAQLIELFKFSVAVALTLFSIGLYGFLVNSSSTKGYFLREEMNQLEDIKFDYNILNLKIIKKEKQKRDSIEFKNFVDIQNIKIKHNIVYLPVDRKISLNK